MGGSHAVSSDSLNNLDKGINKKSAQFFSSRGCIESGPIALVGSREDSNSYTSRSVNSMSDRCRSGGCSE